VPFAAGNLSNQEFCKQNRTRVRWGQIWEASTEIGRVGSPKHQSRQNDRDMIFDGNYGTVRTQNSEIHHRPKQKSNFTNEVRIWKENEFNIPSTALYMT